MCYYCSILHHYLNFVIVIMCVCKQLLTNLHVCGCVSVHACLFVVDVDGLQKLGILILLNWTFLSQDVRWICGQNRSRSQGNRCWRRSKAKMQFFVFWQRKLILKFLMLQVRHKMYNLIFIENGSYMFREMIGGGAHVYYTVMHSFIDTHLWELLWVQV